MLSSVDVMIYVFLSKHIYWIEHGRRQGGGQGDMSPLLCSTFFTLDYYPLTWSRGPLSPLLFFIFAATPMGLGTQISVFDYSLPDTQWLFGHPLSTWLQYICRLEMVSATLIT